MQKQKQYIDALPFSPLVGMCLLATGNVWAQDYFDPGLLSLGGAQLTTTDLSVFEKAGNIPPGTYMVNVFVNQLDQGQHTLFFSANAQGKVEPELTPALLHELGINTQALPAFARLPAEKPVANLATLIPESYVRFDFNQLRLDLSIPQIALRPNIRGAVDPALWDHGIPAFLMNYTVNGGRNWQDAQYGMEKQAQTNLFANLRAGINLDAWRLRSTMTYIRNSVSQHGEDQQNNQNTQFTNTYLQRDITPWRSEILLGESTTSNDVLNSVSFRGIKLNSNDDMLPISQRGFAPVISGIAQTNARVTVSQNGNVVYQTFVPPGPFRISDLYQIGQAGDLTVTIAEADGTVRTQTVMATSLPVMRRPGSLKYEVTAGRYNGGITVNSQEATFVSGTAIYGLPQDITLYGGGLFANDYLSLVAGSGISLGTWGALSADVTTSSTKLPQQDDRKHGASYRVRYAKSIQETGTTLDLAAYRYSTEHYYNFTDFNSLGHRLSYGQVPWALTRQRSSTEIRVSQQMGTRGSFYLSGVRTDYWGNENVMNTLSAGYNGNYRGVSYGLAYSIDRVKSNNSWPENRQLSLNLQVPMSLFSSSASLNRLYASYQMTHDNHGRVQQQAGLSGSALDDRLGYSVMQGWSNDQNNSTSTLNTSYQGSKGNANLGYSYSSNNRSINVGGSGSVVAHSEGVTLGQMIGSSAALVSAPGAGGVSIMQGNVQTNSRGYALVPYMSNYQRNSIDLNPATLPDDVDITQSSLNIYPTKGAVVLANFATRIGYQALITLQLPTGSVPFGALAAVEGAQHDDINTGIVGDDGQAYMSGLPERGTLNINWGREKQQQCRANFDLSKLPKPTANNPIRSLTVRCE